MCTVDSPVEIACAMHSFGKYWKKLSIYASLIRNFYLVGGAGSARDEWLTRVAVLGRAAPLLALPLLSNLIVHRQQQMAHSMTAGAVRHHATSVYHCTNHPPLFIIALHTATAPDSSITSQC